MSEFDHIPGEEREQRWLQERLATLSVRESVALTAAVLRIQPQNAVDAINCLQSLEHYRVHINTGNYEALGHAFLRNETKMPKSAMPFVDLEQTGRYYADQHPGLFVGDCYVEYPSKEVQPVYHGQGSPLPEDSDWSVNPAAPRPRVWPTSRSSSGKKKSWRNFRRKNGMNSGCNWKNRF